MEKNNTKMKSFIAISDIISLLNMSSGFISILCSINNNLNLAAIFMIIAIIFDSSDGWIARKTNRNDEIGFGKNIDSLCDIVSFGVGPAIFLYCCSNIELIGLISLLIVICGVLRLTRYNVLADKLDSNDFIGFPIPGIAFILATYYLSGVFDINTAVVLSVIVSILMISNVKYKKIDNIPLISISAILIILTVLPIDLTLYNINIPSMILLIFSLSYLIINLIKEIITPNN